MIFTDGRYSSQQIASTWKKRRNVRIALNARCAARAAAVSAVKVCIEKVHANWVQVLHMVNIWNGKGKT